MQFAFGGGQFYATRTDITGGVPRRFGGFQDGEIDISFDIKELYGRGQFALALARGKGKIEAKCKFATIDGSVYNDLYFGQTATAGQTVTSENEGAVIPASSPYTITAANGATFVGDLGVYNAATAKPLTRIASGTPTTGQYSVASGGVYTFAAADEGIAVLLNYKCTVTTGTTITLGNPIMGTTPTFALDSTTEYNGQFITMHLNNCASKKLSFPSKQDDWTMNSLDIVASADASGNVGYLSLAA